MKIRPIFAWYDLWVGAFWDKKKRCLYIFPVPMMGVVIQWKPEEPQPMDVRTWEDLEGPDSVLQSYTSLKDMHDKNAIVRAPHIRGLGPDDCPGCLWVRNRVAGSADKVRRLGEHASGNGLTDHG